MIDEIYPKEFIRGIPNKDFVNNGYVLYTAFQFDENGRADGYREASINWLDDLEAITIALNQRKENGKKQFPAGVARLELDKVRMVLDNFYQAGFSYERAPLDNNRFHGNLLISNTLSSQIRQLIMNGLALAAGTNIIPQDESN